MNRNTDDTIDIPASRQATLRSPKSCTCGWELFGNHNHNILCPIHGDICQNRHGGNVHSEAAHQKARHGADKTKRLILEALEGVSGASCEQLESHTGLSHQTCSARISELKRDGRIVKCGTTKTKSGCSAAVYRIA